MSVPFFHVFSHKLVQKLVQDLYLLVFACAPMCYMKIFFRAQENSRTFALSKLIDGALFLLLHASAEGRAKTSSLYVIHTRMRTFNNSIP